MKTWCPTWTCCWKTRIEEQFITDIRIYSRWLFHINPMMCLSCRGSVVCSTLQGETIWDNCFTEELCRGLRWDCVLYLLQVQSRAMSFECKTGESKWGVYLEFCLGHKSGCWRSAFPILRYSGLSLQKLELVNCRTNFSGFWWDRCHQKCCVLV